MFFLFLFFFFNPSFLGVSPVSGQFSGQLRIGVRFVLKHLKLLILPPSTNQFVSEMTMGKTSKVTESSPISLVFSFPWTFSGHSCMSQCSAPQTARRVQGAFCLFLNKICFININNNIGSWWILNSLWTCGGSVFWLQSYTKSCWCILRRAFGTSLRV